MNVTPESTTWRSNAIPPSWSGYSPRPWAPVNCMAPNPIRPTVRSPPILIVPASGDVVLDMSAPQAVDNDDSPDDSGDALRLPRPSFLAVTTAQESVNHQQK